MTISINYDAVDGVGARGGRAGEPAGGVICRICRILSTNCYHYHNFCYYCDLSLL